MNNDIFAIRDLKIGAYKSPFVARNAGDATRMLQGAVRAGNSQLSEYPQDFELYYIGTFNDLSGQLDSVKPEFVCSALSLVAPSAISSKEIAPNGAAGGV